MEGRHVKDFIEHIVHRTEKKRLQQLYFRLLLANFAILLFVNWATVTDSTGKRYCIDVEAESTYDAAHHFLTKSKAHVIREQLPIPSLETMFEVTVNGRVHKVPHTKLQRWINKRREELKGPRGLLFKTTTNTRTVKGLVAAKLKTFS